MSQYKTLHPVRHNGTFYPPESSIKLNESDAETLLALGAVVPASDNRKSGKPKTPEQAD
ncbi:hypothetical protein GCM10023116_07490 [Kistimonas scapharcae]|uniref:DUF7210 domain-containing protein n=1 Tax=Kistimonas scapharcae TaxID=1036133 RepID=A0ABP8UXA8_9GAMM